MKYCFSTYATKRFPSRTVMIGKVAVGSQHPIRVQSMTTSNTRDITATMDQVMRLVDEGCDIVRMTVQGMKEAHACEQIKNGLLRIGYDVPLVADIHFYPPAAMQVVEFVDKVRINPGNFVDKRATFQTTQYDDDAHARERQKIEERFSPLVEKCKKWKKAMRIGTNHGSLSDRIMNQYGNTPQGMVESALEFAHICRLYDYHDFLFSMKASNPKVMIQAYRLLAAKMIELGWDYPLHVGVTEAGEGEDGRIKSAMGIGALLLDGLGDTIRVSLTEDPWHEIDPCQRIVTWAEEQEGQGIKPFEEKYRFIDKTARSEPRISQHVTLHRDGSVVSALDSASLQDPNVYYALGFEKVLDRWQTTKMSVDLLLTKDISIKESWIQSVQAISWKMVDQTSLEEGQAVYVEEDDPLLWKTLQRIQPALIFLRPSCHRVHMCRKFFDDMKAHDMDIPVILQFAYTCSAEDAVIRSAIECGTLLCDGLGDGICLEGPYPLTWIRQLSFNILQSARMRMSKTEFISCPSCGRTLFHLQEVTKRIREKTAHLPGVKIAIMGCIVNGPGEMADADFGYVGSKPGKIDLYIGKQCVEKNIDFSEADDRLIALIKSQGRWVEPQEKITGCS